MSKWTVTKEGREPSREDLKAIVAALKIGISVKELAYAYDFSSSYIYFIRRKARIQPRRPRWVTYLLNYCNSPALRDHSEEIAYNCLGGEHAQ